jgi:hypothetical protein
MVSPSTTHVDWFARRHVWKNEWPIVAASDCGSLMPTPYAAAATITSMTSGCQGARLYDLLRGALLAFRRRRLREKRMMSPSFNSPVMLFAHPRPFGVDFRFRGGGAVFVAIFRERQMVF